MAWPVQEMFGMGAEAAQGSVEAGMRMQVVEAEPFFDAAKGILLYILYGLGPIGCFIVYRWAASAAFGKMNRGIGFPCCSLFRCTLVNIFCWPCAVHEAAREHLTEENNHEVLCWDNRSKAQIVDDVGCWFFFLCPVSAPIMLFYSYFVLAHAASRRNISSAEFKSPSNTCAALFCMPCFVEGLTEKLNAAAVGEPVGVDGGSGAVEISTRPM